MAEINHVNLAIVRVAQAEPRMPDWRECRGDLKIDQAHKRYRRYQCSRSIRVGGQWHVNCGGLGEAQCCVLGRRKVGEAQCYVLGRRKVGEAQCYVLKRRKGGE